MFDIADELNICFDGALGVYWVKQHSNNMFDIITPHFKKKVVASGHELNCMKRNV